MGSKRRFARLCNSFGLQMFVAFGIRPSTCFPNIYNGTCLRLIHAKFVTGGGGEELAMQ